MSDYTKLTNFTSKDSLPTGNAGKVIKGSELDTEYAAISTAIATKADKNSPALSGIPTAPTAAAGTTTTQLATTAFVTTGFPGSANTYTGLQTFKDGAIEIVGTSDSTKKVAFDASGITTATTRTLALPDKSGIVALTSDIPSASNLTTASNVYATGSYAVTSGTSISFTATNTFSAGQEIYITFTNTSGSALSAAVFTIVSATSSTFTITYGSTVTSAGTFTAERYGNVAFANSAEMITGTSTLKAVTPKNFNDAAIGWGQSWQNLTSSRALATSYQNTTGKPIMVGVSAIGGDSSATIEVQVSTNNSTWITIAIMRTQNQDDANGETFSWIAPNNYYYRVIVTNNSATLQNWAELR